MSSEGDERVKTAHGGADPDASTPKGDVWRLFVALNLPEESKREMLNGLGRLGTWFNFIPSREPYLHVTLVFLGNVAPARVPELIPAIGAACEGMQALRLRAEGLGKFGDRVLWVGLQGQQQRLRELAIRLLAATRRFAERPDERPFSPHITLARRGRWANAWRFSGPKFEELLAVQRNTVFAEWTSDRVTLYRSELQPKGARYTTLAEFPLSAGRESAPSIG